MQIWYPPKNFSNVKFADSDEIDEALGITQIPDEDKITAGFIVNSNDFIKPIYFNRKYLLGPEAGHLNISGISGLATKTSYALFLLWLIFQKQAEDTCAIIFNVKQKDLLYIDQPATDLEDIDNRLYKAIGIEDVKPFENVTYLFPKGKRNIDNIYQDSLDSKPNFLEYAYTLKDVQDEIEFLFSEISDPQYTIASICEYIKTTEKLESKKNKKLITTWEDLKDFDEYPESVVGTANAKGIIGRFKRHLRRLTDDSIFVDLHSENDNDIYAGKFIADRLSGGQIFVVDIQPFERSIGTQGFVVGDVVNRIINEINKPSSDNHPHPKNIIFFIDELNRYVPDKPGEPSALAQKIIELARVGRAQGISLFGAEQFMSEIDHQVYENCANNVVGRTGSTELSKQAYNFLDKETKMIVTRLQPGEMILANPLLTQALRIIFPKPLYRRQS